MQHMHSNGASANTSRPRLMQTFILAHKTQLHESRDWSFESCKQWRCMKIPNFGSSVQPSRRPKIKFISGVASRWRIRSEIRCGSSKSVCWLRRGFLSINSHPNFAEWIGKNEWKRMFRPPISSVAHQLPVLPLKLPNRRARGAALLRTCLFYMQNIPANTILCRFENGCDCDARETWQCQQ